MCLICKGSHWPLVLFPTSPLICKSLENNALLPGVMDRYDRKCFTNLVHEGITYFWILANLFHPFRLLA